MKFREFMERSLLIDLYQQFHHHFTPLTTSLKKEGLNLNEALTLLALFFENHKMITPTNLSQTLMIPKDQISHALSKLEKLNFLERHLAPTDKRQRQLSITSKGKSKATRLIEIFNQFEDQLESAKL